MIGSTTTQAIYWTGYIKIKISNISEVFFLLNPTDPTSEFTSRKDSDELEN